MCTFQVQSDFNRCGVFDRAFIMQILHLSLELQVNELFYRHCILHHDFGGIWSGNDK